MNEHDEVLSEFSEISYDDTIGVKIFSNETFDHSIIKCRVSGAKSDENHTFIVEVQKGFYDFFISNQFVQKKTIFNQYLFNIYPVTL